MFAQFIGVLSILQLSSCMTLVERPYDGIDLSKRGGERDGIDKRFQQQFSGFDTLAGMGLGKRASLSTFDSLAGMGLGKRSTGSKRVELSQLDTLAGMGFGKRDSSKQRRMALPRFSTLLSPATSPFIIPRRFLL